MEVVFDLHIVGAKDKVEKHIYYKVLKSNYNANTNINNYNLLYQVLHFLLTYSTGG
jgi:HKD family nuclease